MEHPQTTGHPIPAFIYTFLSIISGTYASIIGNVEVWVRMGAGAVAIVSGFMAVRYYYYATKEKIQTLKTNK